MQMTEPKAKKLWKDPITGIEYLTMTEEEMQKKTAACAKQVLGQAFKAPLAKWIRVRDHMGADDVRWYCSRCNTPFDIFDNTPQEEEMNYCSYCGARMVNANA